MTEKGCRFALLALLANIIRLVQANTAQQATNGNCTYGTLDAITYPDYLGNRYPWGSRTEQDNAPYSSNVPETNVTRYYDFDVRGGIFSPDGYEKHGIFVNGQFPGPAIEANWGDWIEVRVHNNIGDDDGAEEEGTAIHFHGISQKGTPWYDGVPGVSQCPIAPGSSFSYRFRADVYGTSWWHSHYSAQYTAGVYGPMIIYGPKHADYDVDVGPVMLGDYYHSDYHENVEAAASNTTDFKIYVPWSDNSLINGKNNYDCSSNTSAPDAPCNSQAGLAQFRFQPGKTHRLRLMNIGAAALVHFSIDGHKMQVIANDFEPLIPYEADFITLGVAQRTDILVTADADPRATYWMRSTISLNCSVTHNGEGLGIIGYADNMTSTNVNTLDLPTSNMTAAAAAADVTTFLCKNDDLNRTIPYFPQSLDPNPSTVETISVDLFTNSSGQHVWIMNNKTQYTDYNAPTLLQVSDGNLSFPEPDANVYDFGTNRTVRIVLNTVYQSAHPMHLHGHNFQVLAEGPGAWDGDESVFGTNPLRRDTHMQRRYGHLVIQFTLDNPGVWSYHCHIAWHASMGLNMIILERPEDLASPKVVSIVDETCVSWDLWTATHVVDQIDAGI